MRGVKINVPASYVAALMLAVMPLCSCLTAELEKQTEILKEQEAEIARQRREIEEIKTKQKVQEHKLHDCNRAFRDYFEQAQVTADGERAVALYREGLAICPDDDVAHYEVAKLLASQGSYAEAEKEFESAIKINPDFADAKARLDALRNKP
jgi:tetratricopeptide (TPR) repeat protein